MSAAGGYWSRDRIVWTLVGIAIAAGLVWLLNRLSDVLLPFFAACLIAYLLNPVVEFFQNKVRIRNRALAVIVTLLLVAGVLAGIGWLCAPMIGREIDTLSDMIDKYAHRLTSFRYMPEEIKAYLSSFDVQKVTRMLNADYIASVLRKGTDIVTWSLDSAMRVLEWALMFVYVVFVLIDYEEIVRGFKLIFPKRFRAQAMEVVGDVEVAMNSYFRGQGLVALCACVLYCIGFSIVKLPLALVMGVTVGVLYMIPYFQYVTLIPVGLICGIMSLNGGTGFWMMFGKCLLVYGVVQSICDYVITPHIMGKEMGLNPAVILLALSVWGSLMGILGMIIALPATALIMAYYERYVSRL